jgi:hypothetical protein
VPDRAQRLEIETKLKAELDAARAAYQRASINFDAISRDISSALPAPDGAFRVQQAGSEMNLRLRTYNQALKTFSDFILMGKLPDDTPSKASGPV